MLDAGMVATEMLYHLVGSRELDGGAMVLFFFFFFFFFYNNTNK